MNVTWYVYFVWKIEDDEEDDDDEDDVDLDADNNAEDGHDWAVLSAVHITSTWTDDVTCSLDEKRA